MDKLTDEVAKHRKPGYDISPLIVNRWSPRAMTGEPLTDDELMPLFEAARWAPSSANNQPWRFIYAKRDDPEWKTFFGLLMEGNQSWCKDAAALVVIISRKTLEYKEKPNPTHSFDTGSAWVSLAMEGTKRGLVVHGMGGIYYDKIPAALDIPDNFHVEAMCAIGKRAPKETLPEAIQEREFPSDRKPLTEIVMHGRFKE